MVRNSQDKMYSVCVFMDNSNIFHALKQVNADGKKLDYLKLKEFLSSERNSIIRFYYSMPSYHDNPDSLNRQEKSNNFYHFLENNLGFVMVDLPLRERPDDVDGFHRVEKGLDCEIVYDMAVLSRVSNFDEFILVAGDEDYARTVRKIRAETGLPIHVAFFGAKNCSKVLQREASSFIDLNEISELFRNKADI